MPSFSGLSKTRLVSLDLDLQAVLLEAIKVVDFAIIWGHRDEAAQNAAFAGGASQQMWPNSKHNSLPSKAVDIAPFPGLYTRPREDFYFLAGIVKGIASQLGISVRCGCDWDSDGETQDQRFHDLGHIELTEAPATARRLA